MRSIIHQQSECVKKKYKDDGWHQVLTDARVKLKEANERVRELKAAIRDLETKVKNGTPFPI